MRNVLTVLLILTFASVAHSQIPEPQKTAGDPAELEPLPARVQPAPPPEAPNGMDLVPAPTPPPNMPAGMAFVSDGEFWMGRVHTFLVDAIGYFERDRQDNTPAHRVHLDEFFMDQNEVTNEEYAKFAGATGGQKPGQWGRAGEVPSGEERIPVYNVSWDEADAYCAWAGKRLPTEAEWEKAARGGLDRKRFPWGDEGLRLQGSEANDDGYAGQTGRRAHSNYPYGPATVGSYPSNGYGLNDMTGNVWEWVNDWHYRNYYSISPLENPQGPQEGKYKTLRGGGWSDGDERNLMIHFRSYADPEVRSTTVGFRCAQSVSAQ